MLRSILSVLCLGGESPFYGGHPTKDARGLVIPASIASSLLRHGRNSEDASYLSISTWEVRDAQAQLQPVGLPELHLPEPVYTQLTRYLEVQVRPNGTIKHGADSVVIEPYHSNTW
ncbi:hypothetical protein P389DRAFT_193126 [Cystobasidium minutum MCA 4210]|uniref:uncharacterized protein n=1 Tax=Cystobasidium minutum MCA 4210 TaxID=1397322 RepID=UPI0034CE39B8|eukprot:jgi/Rhomi1/193126/gm1.1340_g